MEADTLKAEPFRIKMVEPIRLIPRPERERKIVEAGYNVFRIKAEDVYIDLMTDSGTSAMSDRQWAGLITGDESYAGCRNFYHLQSSVRDILGFDHVMPVHQGRPAESLLFKTLLKKGDIIPFNMPFDTTEANVLANGGQPVHCVYDYAYDHGHRHPFKGNIDPEKLENVIQREGVGKIPLIMMTITNNSGGGQPVSMANFSEVRQIADRHGIPLFFDAARCAENACFIKQREPGYADKSIAEIVREQFSYADGCTFSCKKDALVNIGGLICMRDESLYQKLTPLMILLEGYITYGGLAGRDLEAIAVGLREMVEDDYIAYRVNQVAELADMINDAGVVTVQPTGGHAVFIDAAQFFPHIPREQFPAEVLAVELYKEAGIRSVGLGGLAFMKEDPQTGKVTFPRMELTRLAVPRRVYTDRHMRVVAEAVKRVHARRDSVKGFRIVSAPPVLKHFTAVLAPVD